MSKIDLSKISLTYNPVAILDAVKAVLVLAAGAGIWTVDAATTQWIIGIVTGVLYVVTSWLTRASVTPYPLMPAVVAEAVALISTAPKIYPAGPSGVVSDHSDPAA